MDWIFVVLAWSLLAVGLSLLVWSLLWDRSRGRRRCPKCWYGMDGVPASEMGGWTCPECGRAVVKDRKLFRTRRRWGFATLAAILLLGSYASYAGPIVRDHGWWRLAPDVVLIAMLPQIERFDYHVHYPAQGIAPAVDITANDLHSEFRWRSRPRMQYSNTPDVGEPHWTNGGLWPWEQWLLLHRARTLLAQDTDGRYRHTAAQVLVALDDEANVPAGAEGYAIMARSASVYASLDAYVDYGINVTNGAGPHPYAFFATGMQRPHRFRLESRDNHPFEHSPWHRHVAWRGDAGIIWEWWTITGGVPQQASSLGTALAAIHFGMTGALLPREEWSSPLARLAEPTLVGEEILHGRLVYRLEGADGIGGHTTLWIDAESLLIRRENSYLGDTRYVPVVNDDAAAILD
ncbi:MAG: hypothetical protein RIE77_14905 [Phycisphaerales bacterium]|jgi:hypothetical protein